MMSTKIRWSTAESSSLLFSHQSGHLVLDLNCHQEAMNPPSQGNLFQTSTSNTQPVSHLKMETGLTFTSTGLGISLIMLCWPDYLSELSILTCKKLEKAKEDCHHLNCQQAETLSSVSNMNWEPKSLILQLSFSFHLKPSIENTIGLALLVILSFPYSWTKLARCQLLMRNLVIILCIKELTKCLCIANTLSLKHHLLTKIWYT